MWLSVAGNPVEVVDAASWIVNGYPAPTVQYYDAGPRSARDRVTVSDIGRMVPFGARLTYSQAVGLLARGDDAVWPDPDEDLILDQHPRMSSEQFVQATVFETAARLFSALQGNGNAVAQTSKLLHMKWPAFFPIVDSALRTAYGERAVVLYNKLLLGTGRRRSSGRWLGAPAYWLAVREDLCLERNRQALQCLRRQIEAVPMEATDRDENHRQRLLGLHPLRLLDTVTWGLVTGGLTYLAAHGNHYGVQRSQ